MNLMDKKYKGMVMEGKQKAVEDLKKRIKRLARDDDKFIKSLP